MFKRLHSKNVDIKIRYHVYDEHNIWHCITLKQKIDLVTFLWWTASLHAQDFHGICHIKNLELDRPEIGSGAFSPHSFALLQLSYILALLTAKDRLRQVLWTLCPRATHKALVHTSNVTGSYLGLLTFKYIYNRKKNIFSAKGSQGNLQ